MAGEQILIVEDERAVARGLEYALSHEGLSVAVAGSGERALELGADDYVVKPYHLRELISRVRALLRRAYGELSAAGVGSRRVAFGDVELDLDRFVVSRAGRPVDLTPTEFRLLAHLVAHPNRPQSRAALIEAVWGYDSSLGSERTVDAHIRHLREKLEPDPADPRWLVTVRGGGGSW